MVMLGIMENQMEILGPSKGIYRDYIGGCIGIMESKMENKMETTIVGYRGYIGIIGYYTGKKTIHRCT